MVLPKVVVAVAATVAAEGSGVAVNVEFSLRYRNIDTKFTIRQLGTYSLTERWTILCRVIRFYVAIETESVFRALSRLVSSCFRAF